MKFLHTAGSVGFAGGIVSLMLILHYGPPVGPTVEYESLRMGANAIANGLILPSMVAVLVSGVLAMAVHHPFQNQGWVLLKLVAGILVFEATLGSVSAPNEQALSAVQSAIAGEITTEQLTRRVADKWTALWTLMFLSVVNVGLAIWRPRLRRPAKAA